MADTLMILARKTADAEWVVVEEVDHAIKDTNLLRAILAWRRSHAEVMVVDRGRAEDKYPEAVQAWVA